MSKPVNIGNVYIHLDERFNPFHREIVSRIVRDVDICFAEALDLQPFTSCQCDILYAENTPQCSTGCFGHFIFLYIEEGSCFQWMYQFAHEYCHHLINGAMSSDIKGLIWFEETICELSSMYHLYMASQNWKKLAPLYSDYADQFLWYLNDLLNQNLSLRKTMHLSGFLYSWLPILDQPNYQRSYYNAMAAEMLPLFIENPHLWKIIFQFGDMRTKGSLKEFFEELESSATDDYVASLGRLKTIFFN